MPYDIAVFDNLRRNRDLFPLTRFFKHLFKSTCTEINVVTPNYDRLAEYAADAGNICHYTGFSYGHLRNRVTNGKLRIHSGRNCSRVVNIWKVHGSFDWFRDSDGIALGLPISPTRPIGATPAIVTPGIEKYRITHDEPFHSIKIEADKALKEAAGYVCIGYGFNDPHLQTTLVERCRERRVPIVLLAKTVSSAAHTFLKSGKCGRYLAIEKDGEGCKIYSSEFPSGARAADVSLWQFNDFLNLIMS